MNIEYYRILPSRWPWLSDPAVSLIKESEMQNICFSSPPFGEHFLHRSLQQILNFFWISGPTFFKKVEEQSFWRLHFLHLKKWHLYPAIKWCYGILGHSGQSTVHLQVSLLFLSEVAYCVYTLEQQAEVKDTSLSLHFQASFKVGQYIVLFSRIKSICAKISFLLNNGACWSSQRYCWPHDKGSAGLQLLHGIWKACDEAHLKYYFSFAMFL